MPKKIYTPDKSFKFYAGTENETIIDFYERRGRMTHCYFRRDTDERLPSVTGLVGILKSADILSAWAVKTVREHLLSLSREGRIIGESEIWEAAGKPKEKKEEAGASGKLVHEWCENYIKWKIGLSKVKPKLPKDEQVINGAMAFKNWEEENNVEFIASEKMIYSRRYNYVGLLDIKARINGRLGVVDIKTGNGIYEEAIYQITGYELADEEESGCEYDGDGVIVRFDKNTGEFHSHIVPREHIDALRQGFLACVVLNQNKAITAKILEIKTPVEIITE